MKNAIKKAYTLTEVLIVLVVVGTLILLTIKNGKNVMPDVDKTRCKKAYNTIETVVSKMINDTQLYEGEQGFADTRGITTDFGETFGNNADGIAKFREAFMYEVNAVKDDITCKIYDGNSFTSSDQCFKTSDGTVFGIPNTDFATQNLKNIDGSNFLPITVYANYAKNDDPATGAFFVGVKYDGEIKLTTQVESCNTETNSLKVQCLADGYLNSKSLKK